MNNVLQPRCIWGLSCHVVCNIKSTNGGYLEVKRFLSWYMYSWEKGYITIVSNFWTHCTKKLNRPAWFHHRNMSPVRNVLAPIWPRWFLNELGASKRVQGSVGPTRWRWWPIISSRAFGEHVGQEFVAAEQKSPDNSEENSSSEGLNLRTSKVIEEK